MALVTAVIGVGINSLILLSNPGVGLPGPNNPVYNMEAAVESGEPFVAGALVRGMASFDVSGMPLAKVANVTVELQKIKQNVSGAEAVGKQHISTECSLRIYDKKRDGSSWAPAGQAIVVDGDIPEGHYSFPFELQLPTSEVPT
ncbi:hypothetical protein HK405_001316, partial [Cladochytrium tenue]